jgi:hypothetical protein
MASLRRPGGHRIEVERWKAEHPREMANPARFLCSHFQSSGHSDRNIPTADHTRPTGERPYRPTTARGSQEGCGLIFWAAAALAVPEAPAAKIQSMRLPTAFEGMGNSACWLAEPPNRAPPNLPNS